MAIAQDAVLALADGTVFRGRAFGAVGEAMGELVFNTSMTGYQEILTDPSYEGQLVAMTYPQIGNVGVNREDIESRRPFVRGFIVREYREAPSSWGAEQSLGAYLAHWGIPGIEGIDTRWMGFGDYKAEIEGVKDGWMIQPADVAEKMRQGRFDEIKGDERWNYTYSQRLRSYPCFDFHGQFHTINQLRQVVNNLKHNPTSRSAQCITWDPRWDHNDGQMGPFKWDAYHSPCLQRFWFRLMEKTGGKGYVLHVNGHWRSRDLLKAVPSNIFGVTEGMHEEVRRGLEQELGVPVDRGSYIDINDSLHLYGHYFDPRLQGLDAEAYLEDVFRIAAGEPIDGRVVQPDSDMHAMMMEDIEREYRFRKENPNAGRE